MRESNDAPRFPLAVSWASTPSVAVYNPCVSVHKYFAVMLHQVHINRQLISPTEFGMMR